MNSSLNSFMVAASRGAVSASLAPNVGEAHVAVLTVTGRKLFAPKKGKREASIKGWPPQQAAMSCIAV